MPLFLHNLLEESAKNHPSRTAVVDPRRGACSYSELLSSSTRVAQTLGRLGFRPGDRMGICAHKSIPAVSGIFGALLAGGAYVPVDPTAPMQRAAFIFENCGVRAVLVDPSLAEPLNQAMDGRLAFQEGADGLLLGVISEPRPDGPVNLAYILYTSGSTGRPKGVTISHSVALSFVDWCSETFTPSSCDVFSNHSPFHFDLSILDLFVSIKHGAQVVLIDDELGKQPAMLPELIATHGVTIWYSTPAILRMMLEFGKMERFDYPTLRTVLFAGEVFPAKHIRELKRIWTAQRFFNLYGPTETNVCTYYEIPAVVPEDRTEPYPIGWACSHCQTMVVDANLQPVPDGGEGELLIAGGSVMDGYWNLAEQTERAYHIDGGGARWYRTGDVVVKDGDIFLFRGRRDRMVKRRSYRVELGEIEAALYKHPKVSEAATVATPDEENGVTITAFLATRTGDRLSSIELKKFCADNLPKYMIPDLFRIQSEIPKTSTDKIDYQRLRELAAPAASGNNP